MPVQIQNKTFTDQFGTTNSFFRTNSGDKIVATFRLFNSIKVQSGSGNFFQLDPINNIITWNGGDFELEGFRNGQSVTFVKYTSSGSIITSWNTLVTNVNGNQLDVNSIPTWIDATTGEIIQIIVIPTASNNYCLRESLIFQPNMVQNQQTGSPFSLIDGESTRFFFNLKQLNGSNSINGVPVGNQSGGFVKSCRIIDRTIAETGSIAATTRVWDLEVTFYNAGLYLESFFNTSNCLKFYAKCDFSVFENEPFDKFSLIYNDDADSGWFDEAFNNGILDATLVDAIDEIGYQQQTEVTFVINSPLVPNKYGFGCAYIPQTSAYYKNKPQSQIDLSMMIPTTFMNYPSSIQSPANPDGAEMNMELFQIQSVGNIHTITMRFTPNAQFTDFMDSRDPDDRLFYVWARFGNVNLLVFNGNLIKNPPIAGELDMETHVFLDHSENVNDATGTIFGFESDIEDDLSFIGKFRIPFGSFCDSFVAKIQAWNDITGESFDLQSVFFDIGSIPLVSGKHIINISQPVINTLPNTSLKRNAILVLDPSIDLVEAYGVKIVFPFFNRWEYWLEQLNANVQFYPNDQTKNWFPYDSTSDWTIRLRLELIQDELLYYFNDPALVLKNYDSNQNIDSNIELFIDATNQNVGIVTQGELMRVVGTHELIDGDVWIQDGVWGMLTIEPTESSPRWICSSVVPFDNNSSNPLEPLNTLFCDLTFPTPTIARLECFFDPNKINLENGVKFTSKIKGCSVKSILGKRKTDGLFKLKTDGVLKLKNVN